MPPTHTPSTQGHLTMPGDSLGCHDLGGSWGGGRWEGSATGIWWVEARDTQDGPPTSLPPTQNCPAHLSMVL